MLSQSVIGLMEDNSCSISSIGIIVVLGNNSLLHFYTRIMRYASHKYGYLDIYVDVWIYGYMDGRPLQTKRTTSTTKTMGGQHS